jgi:hypothetical protein
MNPFAREAGRGDTLGAVTPSLPLLRSSKKLEGSQYGIVTVNGEGRLNVVGGNLGVTVRPLLGEAGRNPECRTGVDRQAEEKRELRIR